MKPKVHILGTGGSISGVGRGGVADGVEQVEIGVAADRARRPHRAGQDHRARRLDGEVQEVGRFLERRGAVGDDDAGVGLVYALKKL